MLAAAVVSSPAQAGQAYRGGPQSCLVEVLYSEVLPVGLAFYHTYRATLRVTPPDGPPFETTIEREMPWQAPPPRQGQRQWVPCDAALLQSSFRWF
jgi:hypothetical protein